MSSGYRVSRCIGSSKKCSSSRFFTRRVYHHHQVSISPPIKTKNRSGEETHVERRAEGRIAPLEVDERRRRVALVDTVPAVDVEPADVRLDDVSDRVNVEPRLALAVLELAQENLDKGRAVKKCATGREKKRRTVSNMRMSSMLAKMTWVAFSGKIA